MKKLLLLFVAFSALKVNSQSMLVTDLATSATVAPNAVIEATTSASAQTKITYDIQNTSSVTVEYKVKRYDIVLNPGAEALFCFASYCYGAVTMVSPNPLTLTPNEKASEVQGLNQMLDADLNEGSSVGYSFIKYTFFDKNNPNDSMQFSIKYNILASVNELKNTVTALDIYPNPVQDNATLSLSTPVSKEVKITVFNALGSAMFEKHVLLSEGKNKVNLNTENLSPGIYFASVKTGNNTITKKFIVK